MNVVITDRRAVAAPGLGASTWEAVAISTADYYPFGMLKPSGLKEGALSNGTSTDSNPSVSKIVDISMFRANSTFGCQVNNLKIGKLKTYVSYANNQYMGFLQTDGYRYGFQGQESDDEVKGEGNSVNYKYRMHDPRVGRFFAIDPLSSRYPYWTPYAFSGNQVINARELEGLEPEFCYDSEGRVIDSRFGGFVSCLANNVNPGVPDDVMRTIGTVMFVSGTVISFAGYVAQIIPLPQTQAAARIMIPGGNAMAYLGDGVILLLDLQEGNDEGVTTALVLGAGQFALGKGVSRLVKVEFFDEATKNIAELLISVEGIGAKVATEIIVGSDNNDKEPETDGTETAKKEATFSNGTTKPKILVELEKEMSTEKKEGTGNLMKVLEKAQSKLQPLGTNVIKPKPAN